MKMSPFYQVSAFLFSSLLLAACGGGGGGAPASSGGGQTVVEPYSQEFNPFLPLKQDTSIDYQNGASGLVSKEITFSNSLGADIFSITYGTGDQALELIVESKPEAVKLHGIRGNFEITAEITVKEIIFNTPLVIYDGSNDSYPTATGTAKVYYNNGIIGTTVYPVVNITNNKSEVTTTYVSPIDFGDGDLPAIHIEMDTNVDYDDSLFGYALSIHETLHTEFILVKGLGIANLVADYNADGNTDFNAHIYSLTNLPQPIWFEYDASTMSEPVAVSSTTYLQSLSPVSAPVNPLVYKVANIEELDALGWIAIEEDDINNRFNVTMLYDEAIPSASSLPVSIEVVFEHLTSKERMSANVTLLP